MSRLTAISLSILAAAAALNAQSGRRMEPASAPATVPAFEASGEYSESKPSRRPRADAAGTEERTTSVPAGRKPAPAADDGVITVETNLVTVPVSVFDRNGLYVPGLRREEFRIYEDGVEQEIAYFGAADKPFTVVLLLDTSLSTNYKIEEIRAAATAFVDQLRSEDAVMVIEFDGNVNVLAEATRVRPKIYKAINRADFGYGTSLYDAVDFSLRKKLARIEGRKAVVLFTDGVDTTSEKAGYDSTLGVAEESDAMVFPIYYDTFDWNSKADGTSIRPLLNPIGTRPEDYALGRKYLEELASYTGGRVFRPEATPGGLNAAFAGIAEELRRQYNVGYVPKSSGTPGERKRISVRVYRPDLVLRARDSYIVGNVRRQPPSK